MSKIVICKATDAGYACVLFKNQNPERVSVGFNGTSSQMQILSVIDGMKLAFKYRSNLVVTSSNYVYDVFQNIMEHKRNFWTGLKNPMMFKEMYDVAKLLDSDFELSNNINLYEQASYVSKVIKLVQMGKFSDYTSNPDYGAIKHGIQIK